MKYENSGRNGSWCIQEVTNEAGHCAVQPVIPAIQEDYGQAGFRQKTWELIWKKKNATNTDYLLAFSDFSLSHSWYKN
jgi:hypothetical protein